mgnify:CR=1 FL=1
MLRKFVFHPSGRYYQGDLTLTWSDRERIYGAACCHALCRAFCGIDEYDGLFHNVSLT